MRYRKMPSGILSLEPLILRSAAEPQTPSCFILNMDCGPKVGLRADG